MISGIFLHQMVKLHSSLSKQDTEETWNHRANSYNVVSVRIKPPPLLLLNWYLQEKIQCLNNRSITTQTEKRMLKRKKIKLINTIWETSKPYIVYSLSHPTLTLKEDIAIWLKFLLQIYISLSRDGVNVTTNKHWGRSHSSLMPFCWLSSYNIISSLTWVWQFVEGLWEINRTTK